MPIVVEVDVIHHRVDSHECIDRAFLKEPSSGRCQSRGDDRSEGPVRREVRKQFLDLSTQDVDDSRRKTRLLGELGPLQSGERRDLG